MDSKRNALFLGLVIVQACHSIEEYLGELWNVFPPAKWLTSMVYHDRHIGFLIINIGLFILGLLCWYFLVRPNHKLAIYAIGFWLVIELMNGIGHPIWSIMQSSYTPGVITAPFLLIISLVLFKTIYDDKVRSSKL